MPNSNYVRGRSFEYEVMDILRKAGYSVARTAGSHSPFDIIAHRSTDKLDRTIHILVLAQCKLKKV